MKSDDDNCEKSLEVLCVKYSCRCGFIGDTAEDVWKHQEVEMWECEESDCSDRQDECDHCPEIATGDAAREPLVSLHDVREWLERIVQEHRERAEDAMAAGNEKERYACASVADVIHDEVIRWRNQLEEFTQKGGTE